MASYRKDGVLYDPLKTISRSVDRAVNLNRDIARSNTQHVAELEKEKNRSLRDITQMQKSLVASSSLIATTSSTGYDSNRHIMSRARRLAEGKILTRFASLDEGYYHKQQSIGNNAGQIPVKNRDGSLSSEDNGDTIVRMSRERTRSNDVHAYIERKRAESFTRENTKQDGRSRSGSSRT